MADPYRRDAWRPKLEAVGPRPAEVRFPTAYQEFSSIQGTLFGFYGIYMVFDARILHSPVVDPSKNVPDLNYEAQHLLLEVADLK